MPHDSVFNAGCVAKQDRYTRRALWHRLVRRFSKNHLGVMVDFIPDEAGASNAGLALEGLLISVGCLRHNGSLTDLAHHQNLCMCPLSMYIVPPNQYMSYHASRAPEDAVR